mmetsp:Transcript_11294/g.25006  ORF Transcript_11294/g.25006 Transcript_11294/m.25006 type:complete len:298 (-) Transcript_11294:1852-2745(-)
MTVPLDPGWRRQIRVAHEVGHLATHVSVPPSDGKQHDLQHPRQTITAVSARRSLLRLGLQSCPIQLIFGPLLLRFSKNCVCAVQESTDVRIPHRSLGCAPLFPEDAHVLCSKSADHRVKVSAVHIEWRILENLGHGFICRQIGERLIKLGERQHQIRGSNRYHPKVLERSHSMQHATSTSQLMHCSVIHEGCPPSEHCHQSPHGMCSGQHLATGDGESVGQMKMGMPQVVDQSNSVDEGRPPHELGVLPFFHGGFMPPDLFPVRHSHYQRHAISTECHVRSPRSKEIRTLLQSAEDF